MQALKERGLPSTECSPPGAQPRLHRSQLRLVGSSLLRTRAEALRLLAGRYGFGESRISRARKPCDISRRSRPKVCAAAPYTYDGQFDDARLLIHMVATAHEQGATLLNYVEVTGLTKDAQGFVNGVIARDSETAMNSCRSKSCDQRHRRIRRPPALQCRSNSGTDDQAQPGNSLVFDSAFLAGDSAIMVPHTSDGRVHFCHPVARSHTGRHHRHADRSADA